MKNYNPIWIDDQREAPEGWIWIKSLYDLGEYYEDYSPSVISFDYYLENTLTGMDCLVDILYRNYYDDTGFLDKCTFMNFHSSDDFYSRKMEKFLIENKKELGVPNIVSRCFSAQSDMDSILSFSKKHILQT